MAAQCFFAFILLASGFSAARLQTRDSQFHATLSICQLAAQAISPASDVFYPGSPSYAEDISHWANSSSAPAACSVETGTAQDLRILGNTRTPFAVKGGGHSTNPGFSSTTGVEISMSRFSEVIYNASTQTVEIGSGLIWDDVYAALEPYNVTVVGGRISGVGVAGFTLGGGLSYKTNQYGLAVDNVVAYELVLPNGVVKTITSKDEDLFWGLKVNIGQLIFYDAPTPPSGLFDEFLAIPGIDTTVLKTQSYLSYVKAAALPPGGPRVFYGAASFLQFTKPLLQAVINETKFWGDTLTPHSATVIVNSIEPFLPSLFSHGAPGSSACPPDRSVGLLPINLDYAWTDASEDARMHGALVRSARQMTAAAVAEGQDVALAAVYSNYALFDTPVEDIWGKNVQRLRKIKRRYDPLDVMGLAGGFKFYMVLNYTIEFNGLTTEI
ncbi:hypothetical protein EWM64_g8726 [Hericium alpestre]|uniref:FAD-binding PCMH-type domain-containing protein n=1 Tax=Hericium alpestre TaxID=135208 RepID=A0A4Y9ZKF3_9AGAM|nr:hypothetical protein EWM64_g8726 [Hericium alpestre]